jgi:DNA-binding GntR family transcriptional regulator
MRKPHHNPSPPGAAPAADGMSRSDFVFQALLDSIHDGRFTQGMRLREEELAASLGVSRTPVREALGRLVTRGLAELAPGRGLIIARITGTKILELYSLRAVLEGAAARFAADHASPTEIALLNEAVEACAAAASPAAMAAANQRFHRLLYEVARNRYLEPALNDIQDSLALLPGTTFATEGRAEAAHAEHARIVAAIARRDPDEAEAAARHHIREAQRTRMSQLFSPE